MVKVKLGVPQLVDFQHLVLVGFAIKKKGTWDLEAPRTLGRNLHNLILIRFQCVQTNPQLYAMATHPKTS